MRGQKQENVFARYGLNLNGNDRSMKMRETAGGEDKELPGNNKLFLNPERVSMPEKIGQSL